MSFTICTCSVGAHKKTELVYNTIHGGMTELIAAGVSHLGAIYASAGLGKT
jgi:hypothetical protein